MKKFLDVIAFAFLYLYSLTALAAWPVFAVPDKFFLFSQDYIDTSSCPAGEGRVKAGTEINIQTHLCKSFCPADWSWKQVGDSKCVDLNKGLEISRVVIDHVPNKDGSTNHSIVTASYGEGFQLQFTSSTGEYWHCYEMNPTMHLISCANDQIRF